MPPVADDALAESDALADVLALLVDFALADDDGRFLGLDEAVVEAVDTWPCPGAELVQLGLGVGWPLFLADPLELGLGLAPVLALEDVVGVAVEVSPGLALGLTLALGLALALVDALALELAVLPLLWLPLDDVAGAAAVWVTLLGELVLVSATAGCVDGDAQVLGLS